MIDKSKIGFTIIHHRGDPTHATTVDGHKVEKREFIYVPEIGNVKAADYHGEHFVYADPEALPPLNKKGRWFAMCTCGSPAVIVGKEVYKSDSGLVVCYFHASFGRHTTGDGREWK